VTGARRSGFGIASGVLSVALLAGGAAGVEAAAGGERFLVIEAGGAESLERRLRGPAAEGFRILGACHGVTLQGDDRIVALLERREAGAGAGAAGGPFEYATLQVPGDLGREGSLERANELGEQGYRLFQRHVFARPAIDWWLPAEGYDNQVTLIMERSAEPGRYRYLSLAYGDPESFHRELAGRLDDGFDVLGLWNTFRRPRLLLEQRRDGTTAVPPRGEDAYRMVVAATSNSLKRALRRHGLAGYRIFDSTDQAILAPPIVILERSDGPTDEIKFKLVKQPLEKIRKDKLEQKLNKRSRKGFRVLPRSITGGMLILERVGPLDGAPLLEYRALSSKSAPGIPRGMEQLTAQGYRFVAMFHASDETTVLLDRPRSETAGATAGPAPPAQPTATKAP